MSVFITPTRPKPMALMIATTTSTGRTASPSSPQTLRQAIIPLLVVLWDEFRADIALRVASGCAFVQIDGHGIGVQGEGQGLDVPRQDPVGAGRHRRGRVEGGGRVAVAGGPPAGGSPPRPSRAPPSRPSCCTDRRSFVERANFRTGMKTW